MDLHIKNFLRGPHTLYDPLTGLEEFVNTPILRKWLPGDVIYPNNNVIRSGTKHRAIVGIIDFCNRIGQGFTLRGTPLYLFYPFDPAYPPFLVSAKERATTNILAVVSYEHWDGRWPRGGIKRVLGAVGNKDAEKTMLRLAAGIPTTKETEIAIEKENDFGSYDSSAWDIVCNIDPSGCEDVDDVFAWRSDGTFAIAIADVAAFVKPGSDIDILAREKGTSVYEDTKVVNAMLPPIISTNQASLLADGKKRAVLALVWPTGMTEPSWQRLLLEVNRPHTYKSVLSDSEVCSILPTILTRILAPRKIIVGTDPHEWVEAAMVEYNRRAAEVLTSAGVGLLRVHSGTAITENISLATATECPALAWRGASAGAYAAIGTAHATIGHSGLGLPVYAHASSPLRRYADLVNQRVLKNVLFGGAITPIEPALSMHLNKRNAAIKMYERAIWFLTSLRTDTITETLAICLEYRTFPVDKWNVYVPAWRRYIKARPVDGYFPTGGQTVKLRVFCDLRQVVWDQRCVCAISPL